MMVIRHGNCGAFAAVGGKKTAGRKQGEDEEEEEDAPAVCLSVCLSVRVNKGKLHTKIQIGGAKQNLKKNNTKTKKNTFNNN